MVCDFNKNVYMKMQAQENNENDWFKLIRIFDSLYGDKPIQKYAFTVKILILS